MNRFLWTAVLLCSLTLKTLAAPLPASAPAPFFLHDGDTVVFYGDSITAFQMYTRDIENYVVTRYPQMRVKFINSGWGGDHVAGGSGGTVDLRLKRDVINYKPAVVTISLGMNDGRYQSYGDTAMQEYAAGITHIVDQLTRELPGVRLTLLTPPMYDYDTVPHGPLPAGQSHDYRNPASDYNQTLIKFGDWVKQFGAKRSIAVADVNAPMVEATAEGRRTNPRFTLSMEGIHPTAVGHMIMAAAVLKEWNGAGLVQDLRLAPGETKTITAPLPWPFSDEARRAFVVSPLPGSLNVFRVTMPKAKADAANYSLLVDGKPFKLLENPLRRAILARGLC